MGLQRFEQRLERMVEGAFSKALRGGIQPVEIARRLCADCPVKAPCLEYAMANHIDHGVWGGTSERERRRIARQRRHLTLHTAR